MIARTYALLALAVLLMACDSKESGLGARRGALSLSGTLVSGSAVEGVRAGVRAGQQEGVRAGQTGGVRASVKREANRPDAGQPLPGYTLYCVTFEDTPHAGKGQADSNGGFKLSIEAADVPFGCFVLDPGGTRIADLIFGHGEKAALTAATRLITDTNLGTVVVDTAAFAAFADLSGAEVLESTTSSQAPSDPNHDATGTWNVTECQYWEGTSLKNCDFVRRMFIGDLFYLNQVPARDVATGKRRYLLGAWTNESAFANCGRSEGISSTLQASLGLTTDSGQAASTRPFSFLPEPPKPGNWDEVLGPCTGTDLSGQPRVCRDLPSPAESAACHASCIQTYVALPPDACIEDRSYDYAYLRRYLANPGGQTFNLFAQADSSGFIVQRGAPIARRSFLEVSFSSPLAMSGADVYAFTEGVFESETQTLRSCTSTMTMSASAVLDPDTGIATEDMVFNFGIAPESADFAWCAGHQDRLAFQGLYGTQHLRLKRKKA